MNENKTPEEIKEELDKEIEEAKRDMEQGRVHTAKEVVADIVCPVDPAEANQCDSCQ